MLKFLNRQSAIYLSLWSIVTPKSYLNSKINEYSAIMRAPEFTRIVFLLAFCFIDLLTMSECDSLINTYKLELLNLRNVREILPQLYALIPTTLAHSDI